MHHTLNTLIKLFNDGERRGVASSLSIEGNKLYSYSTVIAIRLPSGNVLLNDKRYSGTTTTQQRKVRQFCRVTEQFDSEEELLAYYDKYMEERNGKNK